MITNGELMKDRQRLADLLGDLAGLCARRELFPNMTEQARLALVDMGFLAVDEELP